MKKQIIKVQKIFKSNAVLELYEDNLKKFETEAYLGKNGVTYNKKEGDGKTPLGKFELGIAFGTHKKSEIKYHNYIEINKNLYWIDDANSQYYNQLIDITKIQIDWKSAEHLIKYSKQYEYAIEIKTNPNYIKGKGSAIFLHCSAHKSTLGCIAIEREKMKYLLDILNENAIIDVSRCVNGDGSV